MSNSRKRAKSNDSSNNSDRKNKRHEAFKESQFIDVLPECDGTNFTQDLSSSLSPWFNTHKVKSGIELLNKEVLDYYRYLKPTEEERFVRRHVVCQIEKVIKDIFPHSQTEVFGSFNTELYLPTSDLDLVVCDSSHQLPTNKMLEKIAYKIEKAGLSERMELILRARVPIIKYIDKQTKFSVDISVNKTSGLDSANIIIKYCNRYDGLKEMILLLKNFFYTRGLNEVFMGGIGSYTIMLLATSFLQLHPQLQNNLINIKDNLGLLFLEFFELYGTCFNYRKVSLIVHDNGAYMRKSVDDQNSKLIYVYDPQDPTNIVSKGSFRVSDIQFACINAYKTIIDEISKINSNNNIDQKNKNGLNNQKSILVKVMGLDEKFCKHREHISALYRELTDHNKENIKKRLNSNRVNKHTLF